MSLLRVIKQPIRSVEQQVYNLLKIAPHSDETKSTAFWLALRPCFLSGDQAVQLSGLRSLMAPVLRGGEAPEAVLA